MYWLFSVTLQKFIMCSIEFCSKYRGWFKTQQSTQLHVEALKMVFETYLPSYYRIKLEKIIFKLHVLRFAVFKNQGKLRWQKFCNQF